MTAKNNQVILDAVMRQKAKNEKEDARVVMKESIEALKDALKERDKMNAACIIDIVELKKELNKYKRMLHELVMKYQELRDAEEVREHED